MHKKFTPGPLGQWIVAIIANLCAMSAAQGFAWPAAVLPKIQKYEVDFSLSEDEQSWLVTLVFLGNVLSPVPAGYIMNQIGRKTSLFVFSTIAIASWIIIFFVHSAVGIFISRVLIGVWAGLVYTIVPVFLGEVVEPRIRGTATAIYSVMLYVGSFYEVLIGPYVDYNTLAILSGVIPLIVFFLLWFVPESPYYYLLKGNKEAARESLQWLRGGDVNEALDKMEEAMKEKLKNAGSFADIYKKATGRRSFMIAAALGIIQRGAGLTLLFAYVTDIVPNSFLSSAESAILLNVVWVVSCFCSSLIMDKFGRRKLFFLSCFGSALGWAAVTIWYYLKEETAIDVMTASWVPLVALIAQGLFYSVGLVSIPQTMQGELFAVNIKGIASAVTAILMALVSGVAVKVYIPIKMHVAMWVNPFICVISCLLGAIFASTFMIETKRRTLEDIQAKLYRKAKGLPRSEVPQKY